MYCSVAAAIIQQFGMYKDWLSIPKFQNLRKYPDDLRQFGLADLGNTGPRERANKTVRVAAKKTNYHDTHGRLSQHVCCVMLCHLSLCIDAF